MKKFNRHKSTFLTGTSLLFTALTVAAACGPKSMDINGAAANSTSALTGKITVSGAFALYPLMVTWADEFQKVNPGVKIEVSAGGAGKGMSDTLGGMVDIGMVSREIFPAEIAKGAAYVGSTIDAVVPTISAANPFKTEILAKGITRQQFIDIYINGSVTDWKQLYPAAKVSGKSDLHAFTRSDACGAADVWAAFLGNKKQENLGGIGVFGDPGLAETVRRDPLAIGYNNIGFAYDARTKKQVNGLLVVPIDINGNGKIDAEENFYGSLDDLNNAISNKVYPWPPARQENLVVLREFKGVTKEFVKWILTDGQKYAPEAGFIPLPADKAQEELKKLGY